MTPDRRQTLAGLAAAALVPTLAQAADETALWGAVRALYDLPDGVIHLENAQFGAMARPVFDTYQRQLRRVNTETSHYARRLAGRELAAARASVAAMLGVSAKEVAFTRNATEAMQALIANYNRLRPGDAVLMCDLDYDSMQTAMRWLKSRRGVDVIEIALPEPATHQGLIDTYEAALIAHPKVRMMLLTHISHRTGLLLPVAEIIAMARTRSVDVLLDSAHAWGQIEMTVPALGADFVGLNLHKWIGAPLGVGALVIRGRAVGAIDPFLGQPENPADPILSRIVSGTANYAAFLTAPVALALHDEIGPARKEARLRALRSVWAEPLRAVAGVEILTPSDPRLFAGITSFRLAGRTSMADNEALAARLLAEHRIFAVARDGPARGACVRATPGVFTTMEDVATLEAAIRNLAT